MEKSGLTSLSGVMISGLAQIFWMCPCAAGPFIDFPEIKSGVFWYRDENGRRIPRASACARILLEAESDIGRPFSHEEITRNLPNILSSTGEVLELVVPTGSSRRCKF